MLIKDLKLSTRSYNALDKMKIKTVEELIEYSTYDLINTRNLGQTSYDEILSKVHLSGYKFANEKGKFSDLLKLSKEEKMKLNIGCLNLSVGTYNALKNSGINTVSDIINKSLNKIMNIKNLGSVRYNELILRINILGFNISEKENTENIVTLSLKEKYNLDIENLNLSTNVYKALTRIGISKISDLTNKSSSELMKFRNIGPLKCQEISESLAQLNLNLKDQKEYLLEQRRQLTDNTDNENKYTK